MKHRGNFWLLLFLLTSLALFAYLTKVLLLKEPQIWPDEALYADIVRNFINEDRLGSDLLKGVVPGAEVRLFGYPLPFYYLLIPWFKLFGFSIAGQRLLSVLASLVFVFIFYFFAKSFFKEKSLWFGAFTAVALTFDFNFLKTSRLSRPEIFLLILLTLAFYLFLQSRKREISGRLQILCLAGSGIFAGLASLVHLIGTLVFLPIILSFLFMEKPWALKSRKFYLFLLAALVPVGLVAFSLFPYIDLWKTQTLQAAIRKGVEEPWLLIAFREEALTVKILYSIYILITVIFFLFSIIRGKKDYLFLSLTLLVAWLYSTYGRMIWYFVLPLPLVYLSLFILLSETKTISKKVVLGALCLLTVGLNLYIQWQNIVNLGGEKYSYERFADKVVSFIPDEKTVFISAIPDPYFAFKAENRKNRLYQFPALAITKEKYFQVLADSDFIIYNRSPNALLFGSLLENYIEQNKLRIYRIDEELQEQAVVIELKPRNKRITFQQ